jgi:hypothetical protein
MSFLLCTHSIPSQLHTNQDDNKKIFIDGKKKSEVCFRDTPLWTNYSYNVGLLQSAFFSLFLSSWKAFMRCGHSTLYYSVSRFRILFCDEKCMICRSCSHLLVYCVGEIVEGLSIV